MYVVLIILLYIIVTSEIYLIQDSVEQKIKFGVGLFVIWVVFTFATRKTQTCRFDKLNCIATGVVNRVMLLPHKFEFKFSDVIDITQSKSVGGEGADDYWIEIKLNTGETIRLNWLKDELEADKWAERIRDMLKNAPAINPYM